MGSLAHITPQRALEQKLAVGWYIVVRLFNSSSTLHFTLKPRFVFDLLTLQTFTKIIHIYNTYICIFSYCISIANQMDRVKNIEKYQSAK